MARLLLDSGRDLGEVDVQIYDGGRRGWEGSLWSPARHVFQYLADTDQLVCLLRLPGGHQGRISIQRASVGRGRTISFVGIGDAPFAEERRIRPD